MYHVERDDLQLISKHESPILQNFLVYLETFGYRYTKKSWGIGDQEYRPYPVRNGAFLCPTLCKHIIGLKNAG